MPATGASPAGFSIERARELVAHGAKQGVRLRVLGGAAVALRATPPTPGVLLRRCNDLDLAVEEGAGRRAGEALVGAGLVALSERFNALHGHRRLIFLDGGEGSLKVDVFVGDLEMCHVVPLRGRLEHDPLTLSPTDLLLSKGQIVELTAKDRLDLYCLLWNHEVLTGGQAGPARAPDTGLRSDAIDADYIARLCARDWGWWRTLSANLSACLRLLPETILQAADRTRIATRLQAVERAVEQAPKSLRWRARSRVGDRVRWYEQPEEIEGPGPTGAVTEADPPGPAASSS